ncbi:siroheme synthase CysG [Thiomicrorhabdus sediminis]|uniref:Siroheme synthase n=1 Tax=Thiomicrorhabdus sediminis TaxID=2580412 RepID=A0A4P9K5Y7_9GAMM|nr:siroheme synthase CysG [Thiomicrorhabdus sediminis]QCU90231.1 uroporphyrinogen-III C-methyltransferase [Thiomicrorhabdus sediminis]
MDYLPIFMNIKDQPCLIVGGGVVAARKADLFIQSGARVSVIAPELKAEMQRFLAQGKIDWVRAEFSAAIVQQNFVQALPKLVISATDEQAVNLAAYEFCQKHDIPVNVADQTEYCDFILPAIVDRSPMTIAISTGGRSPVLARVMKARLEAMIPHGFAKLTDLVGQYRDKVKDAIQSLDGRKAFWEKLLDSVFIDKAVHGKAQEAQAMLEKQLENAGQFEQMPDGEVYIIGAGPGDPELMTFKAQRLLQQADVVLYDRLVSDEIVDLARREAERVYVGKKSKHHALPQEEICQLLVDYAKQGKKVARLKGGDPYIFGRGGEEVEVLASAGIDYQVVPGITAAAGCAAYADFPLTHREFSQSVALVTGHQQEGAAAIDYARLASSGDTMVFYMGIKNAPKIQAGLIAHGMTADTPAAIIEKGTRIDQKVTVTSLGKLTETINQNRIKPPALLVVGEVIKVRERILSAKQQGIVPFKFEQVAQSDHKIAV